MSCPANTYCPFSAQGETWEARSRSLTAHLVGYHGFPQRDAAVVASGWAT